MKQILVPLIALAALAFCVAVLTSASWQPQVRVYFVHPTATSTATTTPSITTVPTAAETPTWTPLPVMGDGCTTDCGS